jgi:hypothetical protein
MPGLLSSKFVYQVGPVIKMKIGKDWNYIGNYNYYSNYLKDLPFVNQYSHQASGKRKIRNRK